jgi:hypothetical protein
MARPVDVIDQPQSRMEEVFSQASGGTLAIRDAGEVVAEKNLFGEVITAQPCKKPRVEADVLRNIKTMAAAAGERWYYRFPVWNNRKKRTEHIEGISIKGTDSVGRYYGNCSIQSVVIDHGPFWMIYSRFVDLETGYTLIRPFKADKEAATLKSEDRARLEQIAMGIAVSKGQRIVVDHALNDFTTYAFEEAKKSLVDEIGKNLAKYRERCVARLEEFGPGIVARAELAYGRKAAEWLAHDLAAIRAEIQAIEGGLESVDNTWPLPTPPEPRRSDAEDATVETGAAAASSPVAEAGPAAATVGQPASPPVSGKPAPLDVTEDRSPEELARDGDAPRPDLSMPIEHWRIADDVLGQENIIKRLDKLLDLAETRADLDAIETENAERIAKITGVRRSNLNVAFKAKRESLP